MYYLYYAGIPVEDQSMEQIGLAVSEDGVHFDRVNGTGLVLPLDRQSRWANLRVCNPTVIWFSGEWLMYYHVAHQEGLRGLVSHSIGLARSQDGVEWRNEPGPVLSVDNMRDIHPGLTRDSKSGGVIEPAILVEEDSLQMWFVGYGNSYRSRTTVNERQIARHRTAIRTDSKLYHAVSVDGCEWHITRNWVLSGNQFGDCSVHYPQVLKVDGGYELWFTLQNNKNEAYAICMMESADGLVMDRLEQVLPKVLEGFTVKEREGFVFKVNGRVPRGVARLNWEVCRIGWGGRNYFGYAHPHVIEEGGERILYYHNYNYGSKKRRTWIDISRCELARARSTHKVVLGPTANPKAWDSWVVADPFVVKRV